MITARYFDVDTQTLKEVQVPHLAMTLAFPIHRRTWPVYDYTLDAPISRPSFHVKEFRLGHSPRAAEGIFDYYYHRTRS